MTTRYPGKALVLGALALVAGCPSPPPARSVRPAADRAKPAEAAPEPAEPEVAARSFVVWSQNITGRSKRNLERSIQHAMNDFPEPPDIFILQECGPPCICGEGTSGPRDGACADVVAPSIASTLASLGKLAQFHFRTQGGRAIVYRSDRFELQGRPYTWGAKADPRPGDNVALCPTVLDGQQLQLSVMLRDKLARPARSILVSSSHWFIGRDCAVKQLDFFENDWKTEPRLRDDSGADAASYVDLALMGGDWNTTPTGSCLVPAYEGGGTASPCASVTLGDDDHIDLGKQDDLWTFCAGPVDACPEGAIRKRVDYLWARTYNDAAITHRMTTDTQPTYSNDHRALRAVFTYGR